MTPSENVSVWNFAYHCYFHCRSSLSWHRTPSGLSVKEICTIECHDVAWADASVPVLIQTQRTKNMRYPFDSTECGKIRSIYFHILVGNFKAAHQIEFIYAPLECCYEYAFFSLSLHISWNRCPPVHILRSTNITQKGRIALKFAVGRRPYTSANCFKRNYTVVSCGQKMAWTASGSFQAVGAVEPIWLNYWLLLFTIILYALFAIDIRSSAWKSSPPTNNCTHSILGGIYTHDVHFVV